jgi:hypothetical protein
MANTPKAELPHTFTLTMGDPSRDGHNMSDSPFFRCNRTLADVKKAFIRASTTHGLDITRQCQEYEDDKFDEKFVKNAKAAFHNRPDLLEWECFNPDPDDRWSGGVDTDTFVELYLEIAKLADPELEWSEDASNADDHFIGGYGLYNC